MPRPVPGNPVPGLVVTRILVDYLPEGYLCAPTAIECFMHSGSGQVLTTASNVSFRGHLCFVSGE